MASKTGAASRPPAKAVAATAKLKEEAAKMKEAPPATTVVPLFQPQQEVDATEEVAVGWSLMDETGEGAASAVPAIDLTGRPKVLMTIGAGSAGKTTLLRWITETILLRDSKAIIAAVDPTNRSLKDYFAGVVEPPSRDPAAVVPWIEKLFQHIMAAGASAAVDFGGGDTSLLQLVAGADIVSTLEEGGVSPVAMYVVSPRVDDLSILATLERSGFQPQATAIVLNEGRQDPTRSREESFAALTRHSVFKAAVARGAVPIWMPRLIPAAEIELRRIQFSTARDGVVPEGKKFIPLGPFDRSRVRQWLDAMAKSFDPVKSWLP
jgi:hypothetical protein